MFLCHSSLLISATFIFMFIFMFSFLFFASICIPIGTCALAGSDPSHRDPSHADKLISRQAAGSVPASEFLRRAFQSCKYWYDVRLIDLRVTYCQQLLSLETGSTLMEVNFPIIAEGRIFNIVSIEPYDELAPPIDGAGVSNNTAFG